MKNFFGKFKKVISNNQKFFRYFTAIFVMIFFITYIGNILGNQSILNPENPIKGIAENSSQVALASHDDPLVEIEELTEEDLEEKKEDDKLKDNAKGTENNEDKKDESKNNKNEGAESDEINPESSNIEIVNSEDANKDTDRSKINEYFTTSIVHNEIVTDEEYSFVIKQKDHGLKVRKTEVFVNNGLVKDFKGTVILDEGINSIKVRVIYEDKDGKIFSVSKTYIVHLNIDEIVIYSNLKDGIKVTKAELSFTASAKKGGKDLPVDVHLNGKKIKEETKNNYNVNLTEGENKFLISASDDEGNTKEKSYLITYEKKDTKIKIITNLKDEQWVTDPNFSFNAIAKVDDEKVKLEVEHHGKYIQGDDKGNYSLTFTEEGRQRINLTAIHGEDIKQETYTIYYRVLPGKGDEDDNDRFNPTIKTNLKEGITIKSSIYNIWVIAKDYKGNRIDASNIIVSCNGKPVSINWTDGGQTSYNLPIRNGANRVDIIARDSEGNRTKSTFRSIKGIVKEKGEVTGHATISIEATTIGLGYIIPPTKVEIREGEDASVLLDNFLKERGFNYEHQGRISDSFYLAHLIKPGLVTNPVIPEDLAELVAEEADRFGPEIYNTDSLGEFDFSNGSGWMYSVNGHYPNYGFADQYLIDGDVIRIRYTLFFGRDIGGAGGLGGQGQNWHKEW